MPSPRPLNVGLVGGGKGAFIVHPHQKAIHFDGTRRVVAGALFPDPKIALEEAANWPYPIKGYGSYDEMIVANQTDIEGSLCHSNFSLWCFCFVRFLE